MYECTIHADYERACPHCQYENTTYFLAEAMDHYEEARWAEARTAALIAQALIASATLAQT